MKKIDILNFITNFRRSPNEIKTKAEILGHVGLEKENILDAMLSELQQAKVVRETELQGQKAYQVISR
jgi:hypothetical protein